MLHKNSKDDGHLVVMRDITQLLLIKINNIIGLSISKFRPYKIKTRDRRHFFFFNYLLNLLHYRPIGNLH